MKIIVPVLALFAVTSQPAFASSIYDFKWKDKNDMRGAYMMCATTGFTGGECPKVLTKCWQPPMIYKRKKKIRTYCTDSPSFTGTESDAQAAAEEAYRRLGQPIPEEK
ncbi:hypothetical protein SOJ74_28765 [Pseudomonas aeruginosa]|uniref:hypothetical protein n=1 Tax=Pseudomonas aeruginosa TaxID=287 RepID=UPI002A6B7398|nr:hypothetical protein [Pseudomonas aeruginosa]MCO3314076.1 hypothetical protein [Pseudomonas aeruginosa]MDY1067298.1 hypothetical protein [Pseudomonas aeruginosa]HCF3230681.1 hypothetical protein [Pseudomonas aeruginosa]